MLVSARDATTTTYVVHTFFQPVPCDCYAGTCNAFDGSCVSDAEWYVSSCNVHCPGSVPCHDREGVRHGIRLGLCVQRDVRWPRLQRAKLSPLSSAFFVLGESANLDSEWTCKCTGSWTGARCDRRPCPNNCSGLGECDETTGECECYLQYQGSDCSEETTVTFLEPISKVVMRHGGEPTWDSTFRPDVDRSVPETSQSKLPIGTGRRSAFSHNIFR